MLIEDSTSCTLYLPITKHTFNDNKRKRSCYSQAYEASQDVLQISLANASSWLLQTSRHLFLEPHTKLLEHPSACNSMNTSGDPQHAFQAENK